MRRLGKERSSGSMPAITGASSLLVIFSVLCLTVFALLSLSTVSANHRITEKNTQALQAYYQAEEEANRTLAQLRDGKVPAGVTVGSAEVFEGMAEQPVFEYSCRISDTQSLMVTVWINSVEENGEYKILRWQEVSTFDWENDEHLPVYTGE